MKNNSVDWVREMQKLQAKTEGEDIRSQLCNCILLCYNSHCINTSSNKDKYFTIIDWDGVLPIPPGWELTEDGFYRPIVNDPGSEVPLEGDNNG